MKKTNVISLEDHREKEFSGRVIKFIKPRMSSMYPQEINKLYLELQTTNTPDEIYEENISHEISFYTLNPIFSTRGMYFVNIGNNSMIGIPWLKYNRLFGCSYLLAPERSFILVKTQDLENKLNEYQFNKSKFSISNISNKFSGLDMYNLLSEENL